MTIRVRSRPAHRHHFLRIRVPRGSHRRRRGHHDIRRHHHLLRLHRDAAAAESTATPATSTTKLPRCALFTGTGNVHGQRTAFELLTMEFFDGFQGLVATAHGHEGEAAGTAGEVVEDVLYDTDGANLPEQGLEILRSAGEGEGSPRRA